jgi:ribosomal protein L40E
MAGVNGKAQAWKSWGSHERVAAEDWSYPTGMVWCPMKMSGMAVMKCAELQKHLGCGSLRQFKMIATTKPASAGLFWPWLRRGRECPQRAEEKEVRELRLALSPLKVVDKSRKNPRAYVCPACGGDKSFGARRCRRCWHGSVKSGI